MLGVYVPYPSMHVRRMFLVVIVICKLLITSALWLYNQSSQSSSKSFPDYHNGDALCLFAHAGCGHAVPIHVGYLRSVHVHLAILMLCLQPLDS